MFIKLGFASQTRQSKPRVKQQHDGSPDGSREEGQQKCSSIGTNNWNIISRSSSTDIGLCTDLVVDEKASSSAIVRTDFRTSQMICSFSGLVTLRES